VVNILIKPEGNILTDRYKSLQKRNILEPRQKAKYDKNFTIFIKLEMLLIFFFFNQRRYHKFWKKRYEKKNALEKTHGL
jgi:hypothetical protein